MNLFQLPLCILLCGVAAAAQTLTNTPQPSAAGKTEPVLVFHVFPTYTQEARASGLKGIVGLEGTVLPNGHIDGVKVVRSLDERYGLDGQAIAAVKKWRFIPAQEGGVAVPSPVALTIRFSPDEARQQPSASADRSGDVEFAAGALSLGDDKISLPAVLKRVPAKYTAAEMKTRLEGFALVDAVVNASGEVMRTRIRQSLDDKNGLDAAALAAAQQFTFKPAVLAGKPVAVVVTLQIDFRMH